MNLRNKDVKKGCCFIEFDSTSTASNILKKYNGANINNFIVKLNWVNSHSKDKNEQIHKKYTVSIYYNNLIDLCRKH